MQVSNDKTYKKVKESLTKIADILQDEKYGVGAIHLISWDMLPSEIALETIRVYGDAQAGFNTMPQEIPSNLYAASLVWLTVHPLQRRIHTFWRAFCAERKIDTHHDRENYYALRADHGAYSLRSLTGEINHAAHYYTFILYSQDADHSAFTLRFLTGEFSYAAHYYIFILYF